LFGTDSSGSWEAVSDWAAAGAAMTRHFTRVETAHVSRGYQTRASDASLLGGLALFTLVSPQMVRYAVRNRLIEVQQRARP